MCVCVCVCVTTPMCVTIHRYESVSGWIRTDATTSIRGPLNRFNITKNQPIDLNVAIVLAWYQDGILHSLRSGKQNLRMRADPWVCLCMFACAPCVSRSGNNQSCECANNIHMSEKGETMFSATVNLKSNVWMSFWFYKKDGNIDKCLAIF